MRSNEELGKIIFGFSVAVLLAGSPGSVARADGTNGDALSTAQILRNVQENYASLTSYSDEGSIASTMSGDVLMNFTTRLARTNLYLIEWQQAGASSYQTHNDEGVWSSGAGNFLQTDSGVRPQASQEISLMDAAVFSDGAAKNIPELFFNLRWGGEEDTLDDSATNERRRADAKLGNIDCYIFTKESEDQTNTLWIGKQDFLIHQVRTDTSGKSMREMAFCDSEPGSGPSPAMAGFTLIETHTNIVLNQKFSRADFIPSFPCFRSSVDE